MARAPGRFRGYPLTKSWPPTTDTVSLFSPCGAGPRTRWPLATWWLAVLLGLGVLDRTLITQLIFVGVVVVIALLGFTSVRVTVAARGVTVGYGVLGLRLTRIPLRRIAFAEAVEREKSILPITGSLLTFGDVSVVLRGGPALRLTLRDGKAFLVTVDDAATGAALLNDLIAAAGSSAAARDTR